MSILQQYLMGRPSGRITRDEVPANRTSMPGMPTSPPARPQPGAFPLNGGGPESGNAPAAAPRSPDDPWMKFIADMMAGNNYTGRFPGGFGLALNRPSFGSAGPGQDNPMSAYAWGRK